MARNPMEGRIAEIQFDSGRHFRIDFLPENKLRWTSIRERDYGATDVESTHVEVLGDGLFAIDWIEKSGLCVSYSVDVNAQFVRSYMSWADSNGPYGGRDFLTHEGPFFFIQDTGERDPRPFTSLEIGRSFLAALCGLPGTAQIKDFLAENFVFEKDQVRHTGAEFLAMQEERCKNGKCCSPQIISASSDKGMVFIETENCSRNGSVLHMLVITDGLISLYKKVG